MKKLARIVNGVFAQNHLINDIVAKVVKYMSCNACVGQYRIHACDRGVTMTVSSMSINSQKAKLLQ